ncbi:hypothetical protein ACHAW5_005496 [Stephanodiscus triporus]|uniref:Uncharacterized protein n=1 Tax=Stephanodiscus triporus TaxID=2934178 RepID=A0ABD3MK93_9STRA
MIDTLGATLERGGGWERWGEREEEEGGAKSSSSSSSSSSSLVTATSVVDSGPHNAEMAERYGGGGT